MKRIAFFITITVFFCHLGSAQQQPMFTQYMFNGLVLNPAYAGSHEAISLTALGRYQWVGLEGAPVTHTFSVHAPIKNDQIGVGGLFVRDEIGVVSQNIAFMSYAYRIRLTSQMVLAMGINGGFVNTRIEQSRLQNTNTADPAFPTEGYFKPNFGAGTYLYNDFFYAGLSAPFLINHDLTNGESEFSSKQDRHYYLTGGVVFDLSPTIKIKPSTLIKLVPGAPLNIDVNTNVILKDIIWLGASYRIRGSVNGIVQINILESLQFGYAHDFGLSDINEFSNGTHEVMINYRIPVQKALIVTPRYF